MDLTGLSLKKKPAKSSLLDTIARVGDRLPDPVLIFVCLIIVLMILSAWAEGAGWSAVNPLSGATVQAESLLSLENIRRLLVEMPATMTAFPPLGLVLVVMLGAAVAERSGLFSALLGGAVRRVPRAALTPCIFVLGVLSHHASDAAYVVMLPLTALVYAQAGRHPLLGIAIAYAGISGAFAGNYIPGQFDVLMLGITEAAAKIIDPNFIMNPLGNWWFTLSIGIVFTPIAWWVADKVVEPRLGKWTGSNSPIGEEEASLGQLTPEQKRGLRHAGIAFLLVVGLFASLTFWPGFSPLIDTEAVGPAQMTPFYKALIAGFFLLFLATGWAFGRATGTIKTHHDAITMMGHGMRDMAPYLVLIFAAAHFIAMFSWSGLGPVLAIKGAELLQGLNLPKPAMLTGLLLMSSGLDIVIGSASAKWSALAPIVVPMLMLLGISPEMTTAAYRMGDSIFNIVTPLASNFPLVLIMCRRWVPNFGIGSLIAMMIPFSIAFMVAGLSLVMIWVGFDLPVGPHAPATYSVALGSVR
jgi:aminobenzoyl-glutamate transport protein